MDLGIQLYQTGDGSGSYRAAEGTLHDAGHLAGTYVDGSIFQAGRAAIVVGAVHVARAHVTNVYVKFMARRRDPQNPGLFSWAPVQTVRSDTGAAAYEHKLAATDPADVLLQTRDAQATGDLRWSVRVDNDGSPLVAGDVVAIGIDVG